MPRVAIKVVARADPNLDRQGVDWAQGRGVGDLHIVIEAIEEKGGRRRWHTCRGRNINRTEGGRIAKHPVVVVDRRIMSDKAYAVIEPPETCQTGLGTGQAGVHAG